MKVAVAQLNPTVGDFAGNLDLLERALERLVPEHPDVVVFPELFLPGYPPLDLLRRDWFVDRCERAVRRVVEISGRLDGVGILAGSVVRAEAGRGSALYNAGVLAAEGRELWRQPKSLLSDTGFFDERRYFIPAPRVRSVRFRSSRLGVTIGDDIWSGPDAHGRSGETDLVESQARAGSDIILAIAASPFSVGAERLRWRFLSEHARRHGLPVVFVNQVGATDELVFDGRSLAVDRHGQAVRVLQAFTEDLAVIDTEADGRLSYSFLNDIAAVHDALVLGVRDYFRKSGFKQAVVGLSGGIDSAVVASIAVRALGAENVLGVSMPSRFSSRGSVRDAARLAENLGMRLMRVPIARLHRSYLRVLGAELPGADASVVGENIQARVRGNILMAVANHSGRIVLATGNKSELAVGYCTLYGDMSGGLAVLADVPKTMVYELAAHINRDGELIPAATIARPPSAELRPGQKDQDTLPPYELLDPILARHVEDGKTNEAIVEEGYDPATVEWVAQAFASSEHKRRQSAPGIRVTSRFFGPGCRVPMAVRHRAE
ncbi:MAG: NAD+ synthase [bacterium]